MWLEYHLTKVLIITQCFLLFLQKPSAKKVYLSGYGVELAIKSQEYKAKDDTQVQGADTHKNICYQCTGASDGLIP